MTVLMYDGTRQLAARIAKKFPTIKKVAGYVDGNYAWTQAEWDLFPNADHVHIAVSSKTNAGDVLDIEKGDASPDEAAGWIEMRKAAGLLVPSVYCNLSTVAAVRAGTGKYVLNKDYNLWLADYDGNTSITYDGISAKQYAALVDYDVSVVYDLSWPHAKAPVASPTGWPANLVLVMGSTGAAVAVLQQALADSGIYGVRGIAVDGNFGGQTLTAVRNFQEAKDLQVDGIAGPQTRSALGIR
jgi:hypothetical protein